MCQTGNFTLIFKLTFNFYQTKLLHYENKFTLNNCSACNFMERNGRAKSAR